MELFTTAMLNTLLTHSKRQAEELMPEIIKRLINHSTTCISKLRMPSGNDIWAPGYDGVVKCDLTTKYVPEGISVWEIGTSDNSLKKVNADYAKRTNEPLGINPLAAVLILVVPHIWAHKKSITAWESEHNDWKEVRIYDASIICDWINSDILTYTWLMETILRLLLLTIQEVTKTWSEFSFDKNSLPGFLKSEFPITIEAPTDETKEQERVAEINAEREAIGNIQTTDIYDYTEDQAERLVNQLIRATHLMSVAARCLPNFEHMMQKPEKDKFVETIYSLPNRIFNIWANETNKEIDGIFDFFKKQSQEYFARKKPLSDDEIKAVLQWSALSLLLDLYNLSVFFSAKETTMPLLSKFNYAHKTTYSIEHLMMLERKSSVNSFLDEADRIIDGADSLLEKTVVKRVIEHAVINRNDFTHSQLDRVKSKYLPNKQLQQRIMAQRFALLNKGDE